MALKAIVDTIEGIDPAVASNYREADGKYVLDVESVNGWSLEDVTGLKSTLAKVNEKVRMLSSQTKAFGDLDPEQARQAIAKLEEFGDMDPDKKAKELAKMEVKQIVDKHAKEIETAQNRSNQLLSELEKHLVTASAIRAIEENKGNVDLLLPHVTKSIKMRESDGRFSAVVTDAEGAERISLKPGSQDSMSISEFVAEMANNATYQPAFNGSGQSGSGSTGANQTSRRTGTITLSREDALNPLKYQAAKAQAAQTGQTLVLPSD